MAAKYAYELSSTSSTGSMSGGSSSSGIVLGSCSTSSISNNEPTSAGPPVVLPPMGTNPPNKKDSGHSSWATQGLPLLDFQHQVLQQLRQIWLEERRKLYPGNGNNVPSTLLHGNSAYGQSNASLQTMSPMKHGAKINAGANGLATTSFTREVLDNGVMDKANSRILCGPSRSQSVNGTPQRNVHKYLQHVVISNGEAENLEDKCGYTPGIYMVSLD